MSFNPLTVPITFMRPQYMSGASAWIEHIPFAFTLIALAQPRTFVELGTQYGDSYFAFCQAVNELKLPTLCTAIDTWTGDKHSGQNSAEVYAQIRACHDSLYDSFSRLLQTDFDSAVKTFPDGSIDLLHIDGLHTYEAVRHDYETWLPKLSSRAVVLFHDTTETRADCGVHRFFPEVAAGHPSFNFHHGHGLGVVALGAQTPPPVLEFLATANTHPDAVRGCYASLGQQNSQFVLFSNLLRQACQVQSEINNFRRHGGLSVDDKWEQYQLALTYPGQMMIYQAQTVRELLQRAR